MQSEESPKAKRGASGRTAGADDPGKNEVPHQAITPGKEKSFEGDAEQKWGSLAVSPNSFCDTHRRTNEELKKSRDEIGV